MVKNNFPHQDFKRCKDVYANLAHVLEYSFLMIKMFVKSCYLLGYWASRVSYKILF